MCPYLVNEIDLETKIYLTILLLLFFVVCFVLLVFFYSILSGWLWTYSINSSMQPTSPLPKLAKTKEEKHWKTKHMLNMYSGHKMWIDYLIPCSSFIGFYTTINWLGSIQVHVIWEWLGERKKNFITFEFEAHRYAHLLFVFGEHFLYLLRKLWKKRYDVERKFVVSGVVRVCAPIIFGFDVCIR